jgi:hypothetical protein
LNWLCFVVFAPLAGSLSDRCRPKALVTVDALMLASTSLAEFYVCLGVCDGASM